jgi:hypothetical protein
MNALRNRLVVVPAFALALGAVSLMTSALLGSSDLPADARSLTASPKAAAAVAPAPEGLSSVTVTRDWQEVGTTITKR